jgi:uncharacterized protein
VIALSLPTFNLMTSLKLVLLTAVLLSTTRFAVSAETPAPTAQAAAPAKPQTFLIVLRVTPKYQDEKVWTPADHATVGAHFKRLQEAEKAGHVILAGRTNEPLDVTQGLVVLTAENEESAREFMDADPCIVAGIMSGTLHPYVVAILKKS